MIPGRLNAVIASSVIAAQLVLVWLAGHVHPAFALLFGWIGMAGYALLHEAEHNLLHPSRVLNDGFGLVHAALFPGSFTFLRASHLGHHTRNRADCELFEQYYPGERLRKTLQFYLLYFGAYWSLIPVATLGVTAWPGLLRAEITHLIRETAAFADGIRPQTIRRIRLEGLAVIALHAALIAWAGWGWVYAYAAYAFTWSSTNFLAHAHSPRHVLDGAHNLRLPRVIELSILHFNWHLAHHQHPSVSWLHLPAHDDPRRARPGWAWAWIAFWRGPVPVAEPSPRPDLDA